MKPVAESYTDVLTFVDPTKPVHVYRNLHRDCLSVRQNGKVVCHARSGVCLHDAQFVVQPAGREKVRRTRKKNVHAYIKGFVVSPRETDSLLPMSWDSVYYNPYHCEHFKSAGEYIDRAEYVDVSGQTSDLCAQIIAFNLTYKKITV